MSDLDLDEDLKGIVAGLVATGRFTSTEAVLREGLELLQEREKMRAEIDAAIAVGLADVAAGRHEPMDEVFDRVEARLRRVQAAE